MAAEGADPEAQYPHLRGPPPPQLYTQRRLEDFSIEVETAPNMHRVPKIKKEENNNLINHHVSYLESLIHEQSAQMAHLRDQLREAQENISHNSTMYMPSLPVSTPVYNFELPHLTRLKVFTGREPTGNNEVSVREWLEQAEQIISDDTCRDKRSKHFSL